MLPTCEKVGKQGRSWGKGTGHCLLTWALASSFCHACTRSELPGALLQGLGLAGCGETLSAREGGGGTQKWVGGKTSPPSHHEGAEARLAPGGRAKALRPARGHLPASLSAPHLAWPLGAGGKSSNNQPRRCKHAPLLSPGTRLYSYTPDPKVRKRGESVWLSRHFPITQRPHHTPLLWLVQRWGLKGTAHLLQPILLLCNGCSEELPTSEACPEDPNSNCPWLLCMNELHFLFCEARTLPSAPGLLLSLCSVFKLN